MLNLSGGTNLRWIRYIKRAVERSILIVAEEVLVAHGCADCTICLQQAEKCAPVFALLDADSEEAGADTVLGY